MISADLGRQLMVKIDGPEMGAMADVTRLVSSSGVNLLSLCAYSFENIVAIMFVTDNNNAARNVLEENGFSVSEEEVVMLQIDNKPGALQEITDRISEEGIDLYLVYGSVDKQGTTVRIVMVSNNNLDVLSIIKLEMGRN